MQDNYTTPRLTLERLHTGHALFVLGLVNTPGWLQFIGNRNIGNEDDAEGYINRILANADIHYWVVNLTGKNTPIGVITLIKRNYLEHHDIGFAFLPAYTGEGYAYEAAYTVLHDIIQDKARTHILATTIKENAASIQLLKKLGLRYSHGIINEGEALDVYSVSTDKLLLNRLVKDFFSLFTNTNGKEPHVEDIYGLCMPQAIIIKKEGASETIYNLADFITPRKQILTDGTLTGFEEYETDETTIITGGIGQRNSRYRKSGYMNSTYFEGQGNKLFQFVKTNGGWKISAVVWEDE